MTRESVRPELEFRISQVLRQLTNPFNLKQKTLHCQMSLSYHPENAQAVSDGRLFRARINLNKTKSLLLRQKMLLI